MKHRSRWRTLSRALQIVCAAGLFGLNIPNSAFADAEESMEVGNHYLRVGTFTGQYRSVNFLEDESSKAEFERLSSKEFANVGFQAGYGYHLNEFFRVEANVEHLDKVNITGESSRGQEFASDVETTSALVWGMVDSPKVSSPLGNTLHVFGGGGVGVSRLTLQESTFKPGQGQKRMTIPSGQRYNPAFGLTAGISQGLTDSLKLDFSVRYMWYGEMEAGESERSGRGHHHRQRANTKEDVELRGSEAMLALRFNL